MISPREPRHLVHRIRRLSPRRAAVLALETTRPTEEVGEPRALLSRLALLVLLRHNGELAHVCEPNDIDGACRACGLPREYTTPDRAA